MSIISFILQQMLNFTVPLLLVALAAMFSERSGVINIGLEGTMVMGAFAGTIYLHFANMDAVDPSLKNILIAVLIATLTGTIYSAFHAFASINMFADQTISGTALNMLSLIHISEPTRRPG